MEFKVFGSSIDVAVVGITNSGKSTFIGSTFLDREFSKKLFENNNGGLTKVTTHYLVKQCETPRVAEVGFNMQKILRNVPDNSVQKMNEKLNSDYSEYNIEPVSADDNGDFMKSLEENLAKFGRRIKSDINIALKYINSKNADNLFKYIKIEVPASDMIINIMKKYKFDSVTFRDTRGFLDSSLEGMEKKSPTLSDSGLDGIQACIIMNGQDTVMPNLGREAYGEFVQTIFKSVPTFIIERNAPMKSFFQFSKKELTYEEYENCLNNDEIMGYNFNEMHKFLSDLDVIDDEGNSENQLINANKRELIIPEVLSLKGGNSKKIDDYNIYEFGVKCVLTNLFETLSEFRTLLSNIVNFFDDECHVNEVSDLFKTIYLEEYFEKVVYEYINYNKYFNNIVRPVTQGYDKNRLINRLVYGNLLGPRGGITTWDNNRNEYMYAATGVFSVTMYNVLNSIIDKMDKNVKFINFIKSTINEKEKIADTYIMEIKRCLMYVLFNKFTDVYANFSGWLIIDRYKSEQSLYHMRKVWNDKNAIDTLAIPDIQKHLDEYNTHYTMKNIDYVRFSQLYFTSIRVINKFFDCVSNNQKYRDDI